MDLLWIVLGALCLLLGFAGSVLPVLPGPPIAALALVFAALARGWDVFSRAEWIAAVAIVTVVTVLDFVIPAWGAKRYGASRFGVFCSVVGMLLGIVFFPPWGMILGTFVGAFLGEVFAGKTDRDALRSAWGTFVGTLLATGAKLAVCGLIAYYFFVRL